MTTQKREPRTFLITRNQPTTPQEQPPMAKTPTTPENFIDYVVENPDLSTFELQLLGTKLVNRLTGLVGFHLDRHVREQMTRINVPGPGPDATNDLDRRNEQDENDRGKEIKAYLTDASGHEVALTPYQLAEICDSLRRIVYERLQEIDGELPEADQILIFGDRSIAGFVSVESSRKGDIERQRTPTEERLTAVGKAALKFRGSVAAAQAREAELATRYANDASARLLSVLTEANSLDYAGSSDDWMRLPQAMRDSIVERIHSNLLLACDPDRPDSLPNKAATARTERAQTELMTSVVTHELVIEHLRRWMDDHSVASNETKNVLAELKRKRDEMMKTAPANETPKHQDMATLESDKV